MGVNRCRTGRKRIDRKAEPGAKRSGATGSRLITHSTALDVAAESGKWLVVSFTNVGYELDPKGGEGGGHQAAVRRIRVRRPSAPDDINAEAKMAHANLESPRRAGFRLCVLQ